MGKLLSETQKCEERSLHERQVAETLNKEAKNGISYDTKYTQRIFTLVSTDGSMVTSKGLSKFSSSQGQGSGAVIGPNQTN